MLARLREQCAVLAAAEERGRRLWAVAAAKAMGPGGPTLVATATGLSHRPLDQGRRERGSLSGDAQEAPPRVRRPGGGRTPLPDHEPTLGADLEAWVEPTSRGDPASPWRWTCKRVRPLAAELPRPGHTVGRQQVADRLADLAYRLQGHRQTTEGTAHPDRKAPFEPMNAPGAAFQTRGPPVVSVDTKKKNWWGMSSMGAEPGGRQATRHWCAPMILPTSLWAR